MREADKSYLWCTEAWFRTKPGTTPRTVCPYVHVRTSHVESLDVLCNSLYPFYIADVRLYSYCVILASTHGARG